jgi:hypothetical protein
MSALILQSILGLWDAVNWDTVSAVISAWGAIAAALVAAYQVRTSKTEAKLRATFDHIREVESTFKPNFEQDADALKERIKNYYSTGGNANGLNQEALNYLTYLDAINLLAFAIAKNSVDIGVAKAYLCTVSQRGGVDVPFLDSVQKDSNINREYSNLIKQIDGCSNQ